MTFLKEILAKKRADIKEMVFEDVQEPAAMPPKFTEILQAQPQKPHIIGEIKRASPSKGIINETVDPVQQAALYEENGVSAISVLTEKHYFHGSFADLAAVSRTVKVPVLCKDFILSKKQIIKAKNAGASLILLIVAALPYMELYELYHYAIDLGLEVLVEVHDEAELKEAEHLGAAIIGVNNRDLKTFKVDRKRSIELAGMFSTDAFHISESGFKTARDIAQLPKSYAGVLIGEALMRETPAQTLQALGGVR
ncbi:MAG: indole-3-glycerol phosphate synthase TrpC [Enterococcaceae bacterium]|jgi:indole-3-glycerol phosphate synthase|nr:indole-3-glycerol phosphate synthase TrpC [Enterococcaceae bacterium]MCI1919788.1 indole-3-glycerol phosphate synthase TrpC [Enterococcaceae bacterium]